MNRTLLAPASYDEMFTEVKLKDGSGTHYGLGVQVSARDGHRVISHSGEVSGFVSQNSVFPDDKVAVTVLTNEDASSAAGALARKIAPLVLGGSAAASASDGTAAAERRALAIFTGLQEGKLDRSQLTAFCDAYFTEEAVGDFAGSLKPLGVPGSFKQMDEELRGGMTFRSFSVSFPDRQLRVTTYEEPDGKLEQYLVIPSGS
ncbi:serine hydrolase [Tunturiibacter empetritectus]